MGQQKHEGAARLERASKELGQPRRQNDSGVRRNIHHARLCATMAEVGRPSAHTGLRSTYRAARPRSLATAPPPTATCRNTERRYIEVQQKEQRLEDIYILPPTCRDD